MKRRWFAWMMFVVFFTTMTAVPIAASAAEPVNLALGKPVTASSQNKTWESPENAVDGKYDGNGWSSAIRQAENWLQVDLGAEYRIGRWKLAHSGADGSNPGYNNKNFSLLYSTDGEHWETADTVTGNPITVEGNFTDRTFEPVTARYVRYYTQEDARLREIEIYAPAGPELPSVTGLSLTGKNVVGYTLSGSYTAFVDALGNQEAGSTATWRRADDAEFLQNVTEIKTEPISAGQAVQYTLTEADNGKYIQFSVTPRSDAAADNVGETVSVQLEQAVRLPVTRPQVTLTAPFAGYRVHENTPITMSAVASADNTEIVKIEYYANDQLVALSETAPFDAVWESPTPGTYEVFARAYNSLSPQETGDSEKVSIRIYAAGESIEPVWAEKWQYDFNQFTPAAYSGVYTTENPLPDGLPGEKPPTLSYQNGSVRSVSGLFGKAADDAHLLTQAGESGREFPRVDFYYADVMDPPIKTIVAEAEVAFSTTTDDHYLFAYRTNVTAYNMFHFQKNGNISYPIGAGTAVETFVDEDGNPLQYEANRWYKVGTVIDLENKEVSYYLDDELLLKREMPEAERQTGVTSIAMSGVKGSTSDGIMYLDNLFIGQVQDSYVNAVLSAPADGDYHLTGDTLQITGYARDSRAGQEIQKVEILLDGVPFLEEAGDHFDFSTAEIPAGKHRLQARAVSADGLIGYSEVINIVVSAVKMPSMYGDDMLLQRNKKLRLSGFGKDGESVTVRLNGVEETTQISGGKWSFELPPQPACKKTTLEFETSDGVTISYDNVAIGELIMLGGQSNMQYTLEKFRNLVDQADQDYADIRLFKQTFTATGTEQTDCNGYWTPATVQEAKTFSGTGFLTAKDYYLSQNKEVPVGLIYAAEGGAGIHTFAPTGAYAYDPDISDSGATNYKAGIAPWKTFTIGHYFYYQGEANTQLSTPYEKLLTQMIDAYREAFDDPTLNFIIVQLPVYDYPTKYGGNRSAIGVREAQWNVSERLENVETVVGVDTGDRWNIHPDDKLPLTQRASLILQHFTNPEDDTLVWRSPSFTHADVQDGVMTLYFKDVGDGLKTKDGAAPRGFTLADENGVFQPVEAVLEGNTVKIDVSSVQGEPKVRYAFTDVPPMDSEDKRPDLNLVNSADLPMAPFRTDRDKYNYKTVQDGVYSDLVNYAPTIRWIQAGQVSDGKCQLTVNARDYDGDISKLEIYKDDVLLGEAEQVTEDTYAYTWTAAQTGTFSFHAVATDNEGTTSIKADDTMGGASKNPRKFVLELADGPAVSYAVAFTNASGEPISYFDGTSDIQAVMEPNTGAVLVLAAYADDTLLQAVTSETGTAALSAGTLSSATLVKAFVWADKEGIRPLCDATVLPKKP